MLSKPRSSYERSEEPFKFIPYDEYFLYRHEAESVLNNACARCRGSGKINLTVGIDHDSVEVTCGDCKGKGKPSAEEIKKAANTMRLLELKRCTYCQLPEASHYGGRSGVTSSECVWAVFRTVHEMAQRLEAIGSELNRVGLLADRHLQTY